MSVLTVSFISDETIDKDRIPMIVRYLKKGLYEINGGNVVAQVIDDVPKGYSEWP